MKPLHRDDLAVERPSGHGELAYRSGDACQGPVAMRARASLAQRRRDDHSAWLPKHAAPLLAKAFPPIRGIPLSLL